MGRPEMNQPPVQSSNQNNPPNPQIDKMANQQNVPTGMVMGRPEKDQPPVQSPVNQNNPLHEPNPQTGTIGYQPNVSTGVPVHNQAQNHWNSDLFACMDDSENALITCVAPCVTFGQIAEIVDEGATPCSTGGVLYGATYMFLVPFLYSHMYRSKIRSKFGLMEVPGPDWITHLFCEHCALCQEYRELKHRGFDPTIGWAANLQAIKQQEMMVPPNGQRMMG